MERGFELALQAGGISLIVLGVIGADFGGDGESSRHGKPQASHLGEVCAFASQEVSLVGSPLGHSIPEEIDGLGSSSHEEASSPPRAALHSRSGALREPEASRILMFGQMKPLLVFALALVIRLAYIADIQDTPTFRSPLVDAYTYHESARAIAQYGPAALETPYYQPPLYPMLLGAILRTGSDWVAPRLVNALLGAMTAVLVYILGAKLAGPWAGIAGALLFAAYGPVLYFEGELLPVALLLFLHSVAIVLAVQADRSEKPLPLLALAGFALGLATAARPTGFLLFAVLALWWLRAHTRRRSSPWPSLAAGGAAALFAILPFSVANLRSGQPVLISWNGGINFYLGNGANSDSLTAIQPGADWERLQRQPRFDGVAEGAGESSYWVKRALRDMKQDPAGWAAAFVRKVDRLFDAKETARNTDWEAFRPLSKILTLPLPGFGVVAPLAFLAVWRGRGNRRILTLLLLSLGCVAFQNLAFFVADRYRTEGAPFLCVLAGAALDDIRMGLRAAGRNARTALIMSALFAAFVWIDLLGERKIDRARDAINRGVALRRLERREEARIAFEEALRYSPQDPDAHRWLGEIALGDKRWNDAIHHFDEALERAPDYVRPLLGKAQVLERSGKAEEAEAPYREALRADPWSADVHLNYGVWLAVQGRRDEAQRIFEEGIRISPTDQRLRRNLQRLHAGL
jgi:tetratricopeptide (TPR) repeat protein